MPGKGAKSPEPEVPEEPPPPPPEANSEALEFLATISKEEIQLLYFSETLNMMSEANQILGQYCVDIKQGYYYSSDGDITLSVMVHATSRGQLEEIPCGTSISGYVSWNLETYEQHHHEFIKFLPLSTDKKTTLLRQQEDMLITRILKEGEDMKTEKISFNLNIMDGFISESANLVLLRVMGWRRKVPHNAKFLTFDGEGKLCHSTYEALGFQTIQLGSEQAEVLVVEQTMHSDEDIPMTWQYYLLPDGHLAKRIQVGSPFCCVINKMPIMREEDDFEPKPVFEKKHLDWEEDVQLFAIFRDRKEELQASHATYMRHHPEAQTLISDFLLFLLLRQPSNVVTFAAEYFGPFARGRPPPPPFRSSNRPSPFRSPGSLCVGYSWLEDMPEQSSEEKTEESSS
ncbi:ciliogenesis-associated TTC17-interacting protein isoform X1 [Dromiciops gliroides]|uniref:ciliogenesis-associated TTC17-interacting protein isoform X1 n=1 Tax=Dromiciops gliroides TaxID=33562 RepID=UPI001CC5CB9E|nr:ciliogenesis-associated TTC17-interacting protein isoform X1 [Dromiciops gliroides]